MLGTEGQSLDVGELTTPSDFNFPRLGLPVKGPAGACCIASGFRPRLHFQGPTTARGTPQEPRRSTLPRPYRLASSFQGHGVLNRKENSSPGRRQRLQGNSRYRDRCTLARRLGDVLSGTRFRNKYLIPFRLQSSTAVRQTPDTLPRPWTWGMGDGDRDGRRPPLALGRAAEVATSLGPGLAGHRSGSPRRRPGERTHLGEGPPGRTCGVPHLNSGHRPGDWT